jgi:hypothetical protein
LFHLVGDRIGSATLFYHPLYQGPTGFFIIFDGGSGLVKCNTEGLNGGLAVDRIDRTPQSFN